MSKVLVTGGAGFIGSHIVDRFRLAGCEVAVLDDLSSGRRENLPSGVVLHQMDVRSEDAAKKLVSFAPDLVVHAAAQISVRRSMDEPLVDAEINVCGVANLLSSASQLPTKPYFIFISTGGAIYGDQDTFPAAENHAIKPVSLYGLNKYVGELYFDFWNRTSGIPFGVLRLANVYGPRQNPHGEAGVVAIFCELLKQGKVPTIYGSGEQTRDFIYVTDVVDAVEALAKQRKHGTFNIGTGKESSVLEIFRGLSAEFKSSSEPKFEHGRAGEQQRSVIDPSHARNVLSWSPATSLEQGLHKTAQWYSEI